MKLAIIVQDQEDAAIVKTLVPSDVIRWCDLLVKPGSNLIAVANAHFRKYHAPLAVLLDTNTSDRTIVSETIGAARTLMNMAVPIKSMSALIICVPELELVFFEDGIDFRRIFPRFEGNFIPLFAKTQPKLQLEVLLDKGGGPRNRDEFLDCLTSEEVEQLRPKDPLAQLIPFLTSHCEPALRGT